jgi:enoyl-CoA hydratase/carnithine racemase
MPKRNREEPAIGSIDVHPSHNGRGSDAWSSSFTHLRLDRPSASYCRVTFNHPPINSVSATTVAELAELVGLVEQDSDLNVLVFDSANPEVYLAQYDPPSDPSRTTALPRGPTGLHAWPDLLVRLSRASVVSIAQVRGRTRGAGTEFVLACDLRFASRKNTLLGHLDPRWSVIPDGGAAARLPRFVGRARALEILLAAHDLDGPSAERYGYLNRLIADDRLDDEVEEIAERIGRFDHDTVAHTKWYVDRVTAPANREFVATHAPPGA